MSDRIESSDDEAARAEKLKGSGALKLELVGLSLEQFETVCRAVGQLDLEYAVDADGHLAVEWPTAAQVGDLRTTVRHGRRDLEQAVLRRLRSRRGTKTIAVDDLTAPERHEVVAALAGQGHLAAVEDLDIVVERRGVTAAEKLVEGVIEGSDDDGAAADGDSRGGRATTPEGVPLAPYAKRITGFVIDASAFLALALLLGLLSDWLGGQAAVGLLVGVVAWFMTSTILHARTGRTLGKSLMGTRVVDAKTMQDVSLARATVRGLVQFLPAVLAAGGILVAVAIHAAVLLLPNRQGMHDRLAGTIVIEDEA